MILFSLPGNREIYISVDYKVYYILFNSFYIVSQMSQETVMRRLGFVLLRMYLLYL